MNTMHGHPAHCSTIAEEPPSCLLDLCKYRDLVRCYIERHQVESAVFWADKLVTLSGEPRDVYMYANTLYLSGQYQRALHLLKAHTMDKRFLVGRLLAAQCLFSCKEYQEALNMIDQSSNKLENPHPDMPSKNIESAICLLRGKIHEAMDNRGPALDCFKDALKEDVHCYEAFEGLVQHHMMTAAEEKQLLDSLPFRKLSAEDAQLVRYLYENLLKKYNKPGEVPTAIVPIASQLARNFDVLVCAAERQYYNCNFQNCYKITTHVLKCDPYNTLCLPLHIAILVELKKLSELFYLAHKLVDLYPSNAVAWFAVGCYYYLANKQEPARRYFSKSTTLSRVFGPAWLAYGHSFAAENEHDQAMAAYFTASQLMKGCHLPMLYIGLEYGLTNNSKLAERFFCQAQLIAPEDPFVLHEMGVIAFQSKEYENAEKYFRLALSKVQAVKSQAVAVKWEPLLNNLGHVCRKLKKYDDALEFHRQSLVLRPHSATSLSALGYVYALKGVFQEAVTCFHKALALKKDDSFSSTMLTNSLEQIVNEYPSIEGVPDTIPRHGYSKPLDMSRANSSTHMVSQSEMPDLPELPEYSEDAFGAGYYVPGARDTTMDDTEMEDA